MRPLASPVLEYRLIALIQLTGGLVSLVLTVVLSRLPWALVLALAAALSFAPWMYLFGYRRFARKAVAAPPPVPAAAAVESPGATRRRVARAHVLLIAGTVAVLAIVGLPEVGAGVLLGNGCAVLLTSRWLARWEREQGRALLREPRWRGNRPGPRGFARGKGIIDPADFYVTVP